MKHKRSIFWGLTVLVVLLGLGLDPPALAAPLEQPTPFPTPTPGPDGRIVYIVQPGDTLWRIAAISGVPLDELRALNNLAPNTVIVEGQQILLGLGGPVADVPTRGPDPTPTSILPTPTPFEGGGVLCILLYEDQNGDALRQEEEPSLPGGAISVSNRDGSVLLTQDTLPGFDPYCFEEVEQDDYNVTVAIPDGYNATTVLNYAVTISGGDEVYLDVGAQPNSETIANAPPPVGTGRSPLLGAVGLALLLVGIGVGLYSWLRGK